MNTGFSVARYLLFLCVIFCVQPATAGPVHEELTIDIGGIKQWITLDGTDDTNPVLLFLHGGPGNSVISYADRFMTDLKKHFVIAHWDQRESGKTATLNPSTQLLAVAQMESDALEVIHYLCDRFSKKKIVLVGHSWGGFLGLRIADSHPELISAYIAVSPVINQLESERMALTWMKDKAKAENNQNALTELAIVKVPFENGEQLFYHRSWLSYFMGNKKFPAKEFVTTWADKWLPLFNEASRVNFFKTTPGLDCPVYFFAGRKDYQTNFKITEDYFNTVKAKKKELFWFEKSAHSPNTTEPEKFQRVIVDSILPNLQR